MRYTLLITSLLLAWPALAQDDPPPSDAPPPPPIREPLPPKVQDPDEQIQPQVVIRREDDRIVDEYSSGGSVYMIRVTPIGGGPSYYLVDTDGDGDEKPADNPTKRAREQPVPESASEAAAGHVARDEAAGQPRRDLADSGHGQSDNSEHGRDDEPDEDGTPVCHTNSYAGTEHKVAADTCCPGYSRLEPGCDGSSRRRSAHNERPL
jgi:hypothetical protein